MTRRLRLAEVDRFEHASGLLEVGLDQLAYPRAGERLTSWLGRAARTRSARAALWLAVSVGLLGSS